MALIKSRETVPKLKKKKDHIRVILGTPMPSTLPYVLRFQ